MLKMRDNAKVTKLKISSKIIEEIKERVALKTNPNARRGIIKQLSGFSACPCDSVPDFQIEFFLGGASRLETYCKKCFKTVYERSKSEPKDRVELANYYNLELTS